MGSFDPLQPNLFATLTHLPLQVLPVKAAVCEFLRSKLTLQTVAQTLALAAANDCIELLEDAVGGNTAACGRVADGCAPGRGCRLALAWLATAWLS